MTHKDIEVLAQRLLDKHNLTALGWKFKWNNRKKALGLCSYKHKCIYVSKFLFDNSTNHIDFDDTVRHEVAHVLSYVHDNHSGHGKPWKKWAVKLGANPRAASKCYEGDAIKGVKYVMVDASNNGCRVIKTYYRRPNAKTINHVHSPTTGIVGKPHTKGNLEVREICKGIIGDKIPTPVYWHE